MKLYGEGPTRWARCLWVLAELGVDFQRVGVGLSSGGHRTADFLKLNPNGKVPVLCDGELTLFESAAICQYLAEKYPEKGLLPESPVERACHTQWCYWCVTELEQPLWRMARHRFIYDPEKRIPEEIKLARTDFRTAAAVLEKALEGKQFLMGDRFLMVDALIGYTLIWADWEKLLDGFPNLVAYVERLKARPSFPAELESNPQQTPTAR